MTIRQLRDKLVSHYGQLYTIKVGPHYIIVVAGIIIKIGDGTISTFDVADSTMNNLIAKLTLVDNFESPHVIRCVDEIVSNNQTNRNFAITNPQSIDSIDELISHKIKKLEEKKQDKWAFAK